jgi:amino acid transporter
MTIVFIVSVESAEELSVGAIVGIAVGGAVVLLLIAGLIFFIVRCKQQA